MELSELYESFFQEADELLDDIERVLLALDPQDPDLEDLNAIFRAAHSIKGGAGAFGFTVLQETTHILENLLDDARRGQLTLTDGIVDTFLETKDMLRDQLDAYRQEMDPDPEAFDRICRTLQAIAREQGANPPQASAASDSGVTPAAEPPAPAQPARASASGAEATATGDEGDAVAESDIDALFDSVAGDADSDAEAASEGRNEARADADDHLVPEADIDDLFDAAASDAKAAVDEAQVADADDAGSAAPEGVERTLELVFRNVDGDDFKRLLEELALLGEVGAQHGDAPARVVALTTDVSVEDIEAVMYFVLEPEQLEVRAAGATAVDSVEAAEATASQTPPAAAAAERETPPGSATPATETPSATSTSAAAAKPAPAAAGSDGGKRSKGSAKARGAARGGAETASIRVPVDKVDQIINLVGELIITHSMLAQSTDELDPAEHDALHYGINLLQRNARDLQEAVMSIRMVPMDYVFSRFPRLVRDTSSKLGKEVELVTEGKSTELDKGLIERIIDPLTHLVRNSMDHGIEAPEVREASGKSRKGQLTLSARHQGGNIVIEVRDDGAGLNREKLLNKARGNGMDLPDSVTDDEVWQLIFAPGLSTAEAVSDLSGRGVGMDVVKRNIQGMGGHVEVASTPGEGTTIRIVLPLTLAILDGMSVKVGEEIFILPLTVVRALLQPTESELYTIAGNDLVLKERDEYLPVVSLADAMGVQSACEKPTDAIAVLVETEGTRFALLIDEPVGQQQVVVKNLETNYRKVPGVSAATILGDGRVALIVDVADLQRRAGARKRAERRWQTA